MKKVILFGLLLFLFACSQDEGADAEQADQQEQEETPLYEHEIYQIGAMDGWEFDSDATVDYEQNVIFTHNKTNAIVSTVSTSNWKEKVVASFSSQVEVVNEEEHYMQVQTNRKENIYGDIYFHEGSDKNVIIIFMTPENLVEENQESIQTFNENITIF
ncbi:hypothetical protein [Gracilibacillus sp. YIM 98692]|uniref:hypothetical protein n=1 Tax=Gracilibacillus sp. YIM 98692 TaxID=2663532 RepID=UPI0013D73F17|nr:hypothetical protein [Gracilibacillus sp. YIM 98692]